MQPPQDRTILVALVPTLVHCPKLYVTIMYIKLPVPDCTITARMGLNCIRM